MMIRSPYTRVATDRVRLRTLPAQDEDGLIEFLLLATNRVSALSNPLNRSVAGEFSCDIGTGRRSLIPLDESEIGVQELLFMVGEFGFGL